MAIIERIPHHDDDCGPGTREMNLTLCVERLAKGSAVLDLGAGGGATSRALRDQGMVVTAVDLRPLPPERFEGIDTEVANLDEGIPAPAGSFDAAICQEVVHQLENPWSFMRDVERVLRPGGTLVMSTPNMYHLFVRVYEVLRNQTPFFLPEHYEHAHQMTPLPLWNLRRMVEQAGLEIEAVTYNMNYVPGLRVKLPGRSPRLGHTLVTVIRKPA